MIPALGEGKNDFSVRKPVRSAKTGLRSNCRSKGLRAGKKRGDLGIIGTWFAGRKEENWRFPTGGSGEWKNGKMPCAYFSAVVTNNLGRKYVRPAMRWSESMRHAATSAERTCDSLSQR